MSEILYGVGSTFEGIARKATPKLKSRGWKNERHKLRLPLP